MKYDKKIANIIRNINDESHNYLEQVTTFNECAYTDRMIEDIIKLSKKLEHYYNKMFEIDDKKSEYER